MSANAITVKDVTKVYRLYDKPIDRLKESLSLTHKSYHKDFYIPATSKIYIHNQEIFQFERLTFQHQDDAPEGSSDI